MKLIRIFVLMGTLLSFSSNTFAAGAAAVKLLDVVAKQTGLEELLVKMGVMGADSAQVRRYIRNATTAFTPNGAQTNPKDLLRAVYKINPIGASEKRMKRELIRALSKNSNDISRDDLITAINNFVHLSGRYGENQIAILNCSLCVSDSLTSHGFLFSSELIESTGLKRIVKTLPEDASELKNYIMTRMRRMKLGDLNRDLLSPADEKSLAIFLSLKEQGTGKQLDFYKAVVAFSTRPDGRSVLLDSGNSHRFWSVLNINGEVNYTKLTKLLNDVSVKGKNEIDKKRVFFSHLSEITDDSGTVAKIKEKNCFFN